MAEAILYRPTFQNQRLVVEFAHYVQKIVHDLDQFLLHEWFNLRGSKCYMVFLSSKNSTNGGDLRYGQEDKGAAMSRLPLFKNCLKSRKKDGQQDFFCRDKTTRQPLISETNIKNPMGLFGILDKKIVEIKLKIFYKQKYQTTMFDSV